MSLLAPLGLLGLIGLIILIIIYIIKPNYQNKFISSTYIWKLSLRYRKKRIPLSKLRDIFLFICQVLIITAAAFILAQPFIDDGIEAKDGEVILIIDASASMQTSINDVTRFERAADAALADAKVALDNGNKISVIIADDKAEFILQQVGNDSRELIYDAFEKISEDPLSMTTNGTPDIDGAMKRAEQITANTKNVTVTLYTDTTYLNAGQVKIHDIKDPAEYNASILDVRATIVENYYRIEIDVACYGADMQLTVGCDIYDFNDTGSTLPLESDVFCSADQVKTLVYAFIPEEMPSIEADTIEESIEVFAYEHIYVHINETDSFESDNSFYLYGGHKPTLKIQYCSSLPNNYYTTALFVLKDALSDDWNIEVTEASENPATEGFDVYIFEHTAPATVPTDGVVIYTNTQNVPNAAGIRLQQDMQSPEELFLTAGDDHPIMKNVTPENISVTRFFSIASYDGYIPLMTYEQYPLLLLKEDIDQKILFMPFSLHYSNLALTAEFPLILRNTINYFFPVALRDYVYETNETLSVDIKTPLLEVTGPDYSGEFDKFPAEIPLENPGTYTLMRDSLSGNPIVESIFVKLPAAENNINLTEDILENPYFYTDADSNDLDLLFYFALTMVALLFIEWWLKSREQI